MSIISIDTVNSHDDGNVYVSAMIEDVVMTHAPTLLDPPEYGPALCEVCFTLEEDEVLPDDEHELIQFLEKLDLEWNLVDTTDYYWIDL